MTSCDLPAIEISSNLTSFLDSSWLDFDSLTMAMIVEETWMDLAADVALTMKRKHWKGKNSNNWHKKLINFIPESLLELALLSDNDNVWVDVVVVVAVSLSCDILSACYFCFISLVIFTMNYHFLLLMRTSLAWRMMEKIDLLLFKVLITASSEENSKKTFTFI